MNETVIDASVCAAWFLPDEGRTETDRLLRDILDGGTRFVAPALWEYEMINILRSAVAHRRLDEHRAKKALHLLSEVPVELVPPDGESRPAILEACLRHNLSAYDAAYLSLADLRGITLLTADRDILRLRSRFRWIKPV